MKPSIVEVGKSLKINKDPKSKIFLVRTLFTKFIIRVESYFPPSPGVRLVEALRAGEHHVPVPTGLHPGQTPAPPASEGVEADQ